MLSRNVLFSKQSVGFVVTAIAVALGMLAGVAGPGRAQDKAAAPAKAWKDAQENQVGYDASQEKDLTKKLALLDKWKQQYPTTEYSEERQDMYLATYVGLNQPRQAFDTAQEILKTRQFNIGALYNALLVVTTIKPAPSAADLDAGEKIATTVLDNPGVFANSNKPANVSAADWAKTADTLKPYATKVLFAIYQTRFAQSKDNKRAIDDFTKFLRRDGTYAQASYQLGGAMLAQIKATNTLQDQPQAFFHLARAAAFDTAPNALDAKTRQQIQAYLTTLYTNFHGTNQGLPELLALAKTNVFPPGDYKIKSNVEIAQEKAAAEDAARAKDPLFYMWTHDIKEGLLKDANLWSSVMGAELPGPDPSDKSDKPAPRFFKAKIISRRWPLCWNSNARISTRMMEPSF